MIPASKSVLSISLLLATLVALEFNGCESGPFDKTTVEITNKLNGLHLLLHCKDKKHDLGSQELDVGGKWSFSFRPNFFAQRTLYFCHFGWNGGGDNWFDIYVQTRDEKYGDFQPWEIYESGPCRTLEERQCAPWDSGASGRRHHLGDDRNNTTSV